MRNDFVGAIFCLLMIFIGSCTERDCCGIDESGDDLLIGTWSLYERGYSPGAGYIVEDVPPGQTITFESDGVMTSNIQDLSDFHFYLFQNGVISFFKNDPGSSPDPNTFTTSYDVTFDGDTIKLTYRYCIEGCHLGLRKAG